MTETEKSPVKPHASPATSPQVTAESSVAPQQEFGGRKGNADPTRFGDWELNGKCVDF